MIETRGITKSFNSHRVLDKINLTAETGKCLVVLGPSGIGKTVLLKIMVGLLQADSGDVYYEGRSLNNMDRKGLSTLRSRMGFVFQSSALFDSMTVFENVALRLIEARKPNINAVVDDILSDFNLLEARALYPGEISGGMKKLVSLARAIVTNPDYLFYDEPTAGLDPAMRERITKEMIRLREKVGATSIVVTHDLDVAFKVGERVLMLKHGRVLEVGSRKEARKHYEE